MDDGCPWCGESAEDMKAASGMRSFDAALEAHAMECEPFLEEMSA